MIAVYSPEEIRRIEFICCQLQQVSMIDLMERAGQAFTDWFHRKFANHKHAVHIFCGNGNNGGDGLVIGRLLHQLGYAVRIYLAEIASNSTPEYNKNLTRIRDMHLVTIAMIHPNESIAIDIHEEDILIDALLGIGAKRPLDEQWKHLVESYNNAKAYKISVDMPSGVPAMGYGKDGCIVADLVVGFEYPKLAYFLPENEKFISSWTLASVGFPQKEDHHLQASYFVTEANDIVGILRPRKKFSNKNNYGHVAIIAGSPTMCGAAILAARSCLRAGAGLVSLYADNECRSSYFSESPEVMLPFRNTINAASLRKYSSVLVGPGMKDVLDINTYLKEAFNAGVKLVLDAEAINELSHDRNLFESIPKGTILTPHTGEFDRLFQIEKPDTLLRLKVGFELCRRLKITILLKGAYTAVITPEGTCIFNTTGNPGMATAGSGDVLAGIITAFVAQGYSDYESAFIAAYLHGLSADLALIKESPESLVASDITAYLGAAFNHLMPHGQH